MVEQGTKDRVAALVSAVHTRPEEFPLRELAALADEPVSVDIDRTGPDTMVYVSPRRDRCFERLSKREFEVATLVAAGFSNRQIADSLFISPATVKDHVHAILSKTGLESRAAVAAAWYRSSPT